MRFQHYLTLSAPWPKGYEARSPISKNTDKAHLHLGRAVPYKLNDMTASFPSVLKVKAKMVPIPIHDTKATLEVIYEGQMMKPCLLYDNQVVYEAMAFNLERCLSENVQGLNTGMSLGRMNFTIQHNPIQVHVKDGIITPPGIKQGRPIWPYGGYFRPGCSLEEIEPLVFTASYKNGESTIMTRRCLEWVGLGVPLDGSVGSDGSCFMGSFPKFNAQSWFTQGGAALHIPLGVGDDGSTYFITYRSKLVQQPDRTLPFVEVTFYKENML